MKSLRPSTRFVATCVTLAAFGCPGVAAAEPPSDLSASFDLAADPLWCSFPIHIDVVGTGKVIDHGDGRTTEVYQGFRVTVTNLADPTKSTTFNVPGTVRNLPQEDGTVVHVMTGPNLSGDTNGGLAFTVGRFVWVTDASGAVIVHRNGNGRFEPACPMIA